MNQFYSTAKVLFFSILLLTSVSSCMTTKTNVGTFKETQGEEYTYAKGKQMWLFWGLIPLGRTSVSTPADGNCQVITRYNFGDAVISSITGGIFTTHTIKIKAKRPESKTNAEKKDKN
ncbi:MAG: hypothetical protein EBU01_15340 [Crocinitomicaceae bacterium]|nr:hypothetical protein [Crocinitomicaceae bacterium]